MDDFCVPRHLLERLLTYLVSRPYAEVAALIQELAACQILPAQTPPPAKEGEDGTGNPDAH